MRSAVAPPFALLAVLALSTSPALAGDGDPELLFRQGRTLLSEGNYAEACIKFAESYRLDRKLGTLLNLAGCHELQGKTATAYAEYGAAAAEADRTGRAERAQFARGQAAALEKKLSRVQLRASQTASAEVFLDGRRVAALGESFPADPGEHLVAVRAAGFREWSRPVQVEPGPWSTVIDVPALDPAPAASSTSPPTTPTDATDGADRPGQRTLGFVLGGVGLVGVGVGSYFGIRTFALKSDADGHCDATGCDERGRELDADADSSATLSTVFIAVGAVAVAAGVFLVVTSFKKTPPPAALLSNQVGFRF